jgi:predicted transcriptional regulator
MAKSSQDASGSTCRTTVTIPREDHELLERLAEVKHVSLAWVIRDAIRSYLDQQTPLFASTAHHHPGAS